MTADEFRGFKLEMGWSAKRLAFELGKGIETIRRYLKDGVPDREAVVVWLACEALRAGLRKAA